MDKMKPFTIENIPTQYDEESLTVLELCSRLAAKFNEMADAYGYTMRDVRKAIAVWLSNNPDASASVNNYLTPQAFGAVGDGVHDDTGAVKLALASGADVYFPRGTYLVTEGLSLTGGQHVYGDGVGSIIKSGAPVILTTTAAGTLVERLALEGITTNTGMAIYKDKNTVRDVSITKCATGITNKNSDYMGSVIFDGVHFDNVSTCFRCTTLCNGVTFRGCVAYHYDAFVEAYWMEGVTFDTCFMEKSNPASAVLRQIPSRSALQALGVTDRKSVV